MEVGIFLAKYNFELKKKVVLEYLNGEGGAKFLAKKYDIPHDLSVKQWIHNYDSFGNEELMRSQQNQNFSFVFKMMVAELYLSSELSIHHLAIQEKINNPALISKWVNDFRIAGPDALRPKKKGLKKLLDKFCKNKEIQNDESMPVDKSTEHIKQLEDELLKLKIENTYLKELRRLRLEEEALLKKQRKSSTAFEDTSN